MLILYFVWKDTNLTWKSLLNTRNFTKETSEVHCVSDRVKSKRTFIHETFLRSGIGILQATFRGPERWSWVQHWLTCSSQPRITLSPDYYAPRYICIPVGIRPDCRAGRWTAEHLIMWSKMSRSQRSQLDADRLKHFFQLGTC